MRYVYDHDLHIHSGLSKCSGDAEQNKDRILKYALDNGLRNICVTDHFWDKSVQGASEWYVSQDYEWITKILPLPKSEKVNFMFGAETEMTHGGIIGISREALDKLDFLIVPTTHLNNVGFGVSEENAKTPEGRAKTWVEKFTALLSYDLPYHKMGVAHLACSLIAPKRDMYLATLDALDEGDMRRCFTRAAELGIGVELNSYDMRFKEEEAATVLRIFEIAKACGCKFYLGSDAHHPEALDTAKDVFERAIDYLELKESDKFLFVK